jgi:uncharacterized protein (TIRG00374 family)
MSQIRDRNAVEAEPPRRSRPSTMEPGSVRSFVREHRRVLLTLLAAGVAVVFALAVVPQIAGFGETLDRLRQGDKVWLLLGAGFEALSLGGYIALFKTVFSAEGVTRIGWKVSYQITFAGVVATKLFAAAGAGGVALTVWALGAAGMRPAVVARRIAAFEILLYAVFMGSLIVFGLGLRTGILPGEAPFSLTVVPAVIGACVIGLVVAFILVPHDIDLKLRPPSGASTTRRDRLVRGLATGPSTIRGGLVTATEIIRHPKLGLLGAFAYWAFDIATLWASFRAFGATPDFPVVVIAYFVGQAANAIPLPGGIGLVEGGMVGAFIAFGVGGSVAVIAVLVYRALSFWLPTLPGSAAYFQLRRTIDGWREEDGKPPVDGPGPGPAADSPQR